MVDSVALFVYFTCLSGFECVHKGLCTHLLFSLMLPLVSFPGECPLLRFTLLEPAAVFPLDTALPPWACLLLPFLISMIFPLVSHVHMAKSNVKQSSLSSLCFVLGIGSRV